MFLAVIGGIFILISYLAMRKEFRRPIGIIFMVIGAPMLLLTLLQIQYGISFFIFPALLLLVTGLILALDIIGGIFTIIIGIIVTYVGIWILPIFGIVLIIIGVISIILKIIENKTSISKAP